MSRRRPVKRFYSLDDIALRKYQLEEAIEEDEKKIKLIWEFLNTDEENDKSLSSQLSSMVSYGVMAYDGFMTFRKLKSKYGSLKNFFKRH